MNRLAVFGLLNASTRTRFLGPCVVLALLVGIVGASAQSADRKPFQSLETLKKQAASGDAYAQNSLGVKYATGTGVPKDYEQAVIWFRKSAEQGLAAAQANLGNAYHDGLGVAQDYLTALLYFRHAADQGQADAQLMLGMMLYMGQGVAQDYAQAAIWWRKASDQGSSLAQYNLGVLYYNGEGVPQDYREAYFWLNIAATGKLEDSIQSEAIADRNYAAANLTKTVLLQTQERARKWFEAHPVKP